MSRNSEIKHDKEYIVYRIRTIKHLIIPEERKKTDFKSLQVILFKMSGFILRIYNLECAHTKE